MSPSNPITYKTTQTHKQPYWKVRINGDGTSFVPMRPMSYFEVVEYMKGRFPGYDIEVCV